MAKTKISEFSSTPGNNTDIDGINIAEGCAPSGINDAIRELMSQLKDFQTGSAGDSFNGPVGTTTAAAGAFTTLSASSTVSGTGFSTYLASPPAIGGTAAAAGSFTTLSASSTTTLSGLTASTALALDASKNVVSVTNTGTGNNVLSASPTLTGTVGLADLTASGSVTLSGGTANGVLYLNGSKVATSGSALTFDGNSLNVTKTTATFAIPVYQFNTGAINGIFTGDTTLGAVSLGSYTNHPLAFYINNSEQARLNSTGLGIGCSPSYKLDVQSSAVSGIAANFQATAANTYGVINITGNSRGGEIDFYNGSTAQAAIVGGTGNLYFYTNGNSSLKATLDTAGNLGLGVAPSAWSGGFKALQIGAAGSVQSASDNSFRFSYNSYYDGAAYKRITASAASYHILDIDGSFSWLQAGSSTAGSSISWTTSMTLDASGNLGIGTSSPSQKLEVAGKVLLNVSAPQVILNRSGTTYQSDIKFQTAGTNNWSIGQALGAVGSNLEFYDYGVGATRMQIDTSGNFFVGNTIVNPASGFSNQKGLGYDATNGKLEVATTANDYTVELGRNNANDGGIVNFRKQSTAVGSISVTGSATAYNTSSDYRLKNNQQALTGSGAFIDALKPKTWEWKADGSKGVGFIAHEVQEVSPGTVVGEKDAVDEDGKPKYQAMEYGSAEFIANIIAELQSLRQRVAQLEKGN